jgi:hypothetical protein
MLGLKKALTLLKIRSERADRGQLPNASKLLKQRVRGINTNEKSGQYLKLCSEDGGGKQRGMRVQRGCFEDFIDIL